MGFAVNVGGYPAAPAAPPGARAGVKGWQFAVVCMDGRWRGIYNGHWWTRESAATVAGWRDGPAGRAS
jgi:hypothetical protein